MDFWNNGVMVWVEKLSYVAAERIFVNSAIWLYRRGNQTGQAFHTAGRAHRQGELRKSIANKVLVIHLAVQQHF